MTDLTPCPFCGSSDVDRHGWRDGQGQQGPECMGCGATARDTDSWNRRTPPEGMALVPRAITAETGHKAGMMSEFSQSIPMWCEVCEGDGVSVADGGPCANCNGAGEYVRNVNISWTTIKAIHKRIVELSEEGQTP